MNCTVVLMKSNEVGKVEFVDFQIPSNWIELKKLPKVLNIFNPDKVVPIFYEFSELIYEGKHVYCQLLHKPSHQATSQP